MLTCVQIWLHAGTWQEAENEVRATDLSLRVCSMWTSQKEKANFLDARAMKTREETP